MEGTAAAPVQKIAEGLHDERTVGAMAEIDRRQRRPQPVAEHLIVHAGHRNLIRHTDPAVAFQALNDFYGKKIDKAVEHGKIACNRREFLFFGKFPEAHYALHPCLPT